MTRRDHLGEFAAAAHSDTALRLIEAYRAAVQDNTLGQASIAVHLRAVLEEKLAERADAPPRTVGS
jgi:hypothetical protein